MAFDFDRASALEKFPRCGCCINCKLVVWSGEAQLNGAASRYVSKPFKATGATDKPPLVMVRCNWLKSPIEKPENLHICDGWRAAGDDVDARDGA